MAIIIVAFLIGLPLLAFLAFPIFLMAFLGVTIDTNIVHVTSRKAKKIKLHAGNEFTQVA